MDELIKELREHLEAKGYKPVWHSAVDVLPIGEDSETIMFLLEKIADLQKEVKELKGA